ncbi:t-SNARE VTI1 [Saxophila tyrrhenica]|uniref:t-SNARE VTI1 n=1 Tax=Saxophila tyrrhenica TaxID=1690608 RepID=A0AAV9PPV8_9PEZI|nr:t-SNARE VTI1 [Saxophila tyrrhenica]
MANPLDGPPGSELFSSYEAELRLVTADISQKLDSLPTLTAEPRKATLSQTSRALEEADELLGSMRLEKQNIPSVQKQKVNQRFRNHESDVDALKRKLKGLESDDRARLFGGRYTDNPGENGGGDAGVEQRQQLLSGTDRLERSSGRLRESQRIALETEDIGRNTLADLGRQRETIEHTRGTLLENAEGDGETVGSGEFVGIEGA